MGSIRLVNDKSLFTVDIEMKSKNEIKKKGLHFGDAQITTD